MDAFFLHPRHHGGVAGTDPAGAVDVGGAVVGGVDADSHLHCAVFVACVVAAAAAVLPRVGQLQHSGQQPGLGPLQLALWEQVQVGMRVLRQHQLGLSLAGPEVGFGVVEAGPGLVLAEVRLVLEAVAGVGVVAEVDLEPEPEVFGLG